MKIVTLANQKGGVAKTTTTWHLGAGLARKGYKVLLVDMDPQSNLSLTTGIDLLNIEHTLFDVFQGNVSSKEALIRVMDNIDILVGGIDLAAADRIFTQLGREKMLLKALKPLKDKYDFCVIDTPPSLGIMNENAFTCTDYVIVPIQADVYSLQGTSQLSGFIDDIKENTNPDLELMGILITRVQSRTNLFNILYPEFEKVANSMNTRIFETTIRSAVTVGEAALKRTTLYNHADGATATMDYINFVDEFLTLLT